MIETIRKKNFQVSVNAWNNLLNCIWFQREMVMFWTLKRGLSCGYFEDVNTLNLVIYVFFSVGCYQCGIG